MSFDSLLKAARRHVFEGDVPSAVELWLAVLDQDPKHREALPMLMDLAKRTNDRRILAQTLQAVRDLK
jgi:hypothetical protein